MSSSTLLGYHVVLTLHNSRVSDRMLQYQVQKGRPLRLRFEQEIILSKIIGSIITENQYRCVAFNICRDHVHLLLVCKYDELSKAIQKLKAMSSKLFNKSGAISADQIDYHKNHLWSQKYYRATLDDWQFAKLSTKPGEVYQSDHLLNSIRYIQNNRRKHGLKESEALDKIISSFTIPLEKAYHI